MHRQHELLGNAQAEAGALATRVGPLEGVKPVEDPSLGVVGDTRPLVLDRDLRDLAGDIREMLHLPQVVH